MAMTKQFLARDYMIHVENERFKHYVYTETFTVYSTSQAYHIMNDWKEHGWTVTVLNIAFRTEEYQIHRL